MSYYANMPPTGRYVTGKLILVCFGLAFLGIALSIAWSMSWGSILTELAALLLAGSSLRLQLALRRYWIVQGRPIQPGDPRKYIVLTCLFLGVISFFLIGELLHVAGWWW